MCHAEDPGVSYHDYLKGWHQTEEYDAAGPWSDAVDDGNSGELTDVTEVRNGVSVHVTTLTFRMAACVDKSTLPDACNPQSWRYMDRSGNYYFIGNGQRPYPEVTINDENSRGSNARMVTVSVKWVSTTGPLKLRR